MVGGGLGPYAPGEYSDDTQMAVCVATAAVSVPDLRAEESLDQVAARFLQWKADGASDIGVQTSQVLSATRGLKASAALMRRRAAELHGRTGRSTGNGSLMRTAPVALAFLSDPVAMAQAARAVSDLTHHDPLAGDACVLWCAAIREAVLTGELTLSAGLEVLPSERRDQWVQWIGEAADREPHHFTPNGFVVRALQAAWSAVIRTPVPDQAPERGSFAAHHLRDALVAAVKAGNDTDTVAAIAGSLLGARWGASAVPLEWHRAVHG
ncbi:hypothetical protein GCM10010468_81730 [Actinocorallia longicatena]|uniref:ADP-ribosylglycohydrolase n=2 Tax=Actinocorallia longicatena TaxID=111803 RepID=A0ABP6QPD5_9ACTN